MELRQMYNQKSVGEIADALKNAYPGFEKDIFLKSVFAPDWKNLALKQRIRRIACSIEPCLNLTYRQSIDVLSVAISSLDDLGFEKSVFPDFVELFGLQDWEASMRALEFFTQFVSAEFAIRPFIESNQERTMAQMLVWSKHEHEAVRRLSCEGCRPRLPWGMALGQLKADPSPILPILENLKNDNSESVRRSVANNLNDISKDNPQVTLSLLSKWQTKETAETRWITGHALRTLLKAGNPAALALLGYASEPDLLVKSVVVSPAIISTGESVKFSFTVQSTSKVKQPLMVDFVVHYVRANDRTTRKVFKLSKKSLEPGEEISFSKNISFRPITTRRYYPGRHSIQPQINGRLFEICQFELRGPAHEP